MCCLYLPLLLSVFPQSTSFSNNPFLSTLSIHFSWLFYMLSSVQVVSHLSNFFSLVQDTHESFYQSQSNCTQSFLHNVDMLSPAYYLQYSHLKKRADHTEDFNMFNFVPRMMYLFSSVIYTIYSPFSLHSIEAIFSQSLLTQH